MSEKGDIKERILMNSLFSILTPSYNKGEYVLDAVRSVLNQSCGNWDYTIVDNSTDEKTRQVLRSSVELRDPKITYIERDFTQMERERFYVPARIVNEYYPVLKGKYILFLADDDYLMQDCLLQFARFMEASNVPMAYCMMKVEFVTVEDKNIELAIYPSPDKFTKRGKGQLDREVDGGQVVHTRECALEMPHPIMPESVAEAYHADGAFLENMASLGEFAPINCAKPLVVHRITPLSTWFNARRSVKLIELEPLNDDNYMLLLKWRNENRKFFISQVEIDEVAHDRWYDLYKESRNRQTYIVKVNGARIGTIGAVHESAETVVIANVMLGDKSYARQGCMSVALDMVMQRHPSKRYFLTVLKSNDAAIAFYKKRGFTVCAELDDAYKMEKICS